MTQFLPILLGSDINVYGMARAFHEAYGVHSDCYAQLQLAPTRFSKIINMHIVPDFSNFVTFRDTMIRVGKAYKQQNPERTLVLIPCGDVYANLLSQCGDDLRPWFAYHTLDMKLTRELTIKSSFYKICEHYNLPHPATVSLTREQVQQKAYRALPFDYPVAMKPANSVEWLSIDFEGRKKAYIFNDPKELDTIIQRAYAAGYASEMIIQDFIPGDDSRMRVLNAYVDRNHHVRMMMLGHPLLEDPTPVAVGNYAIIEPDYNESICRRVADFLQAIGYEGMANFDMKYDERDGEYKLFEINLRQGRSSYFVTLNGQNLARYFVDDLVHNTEFDGEPTIAKGDKLWLQVPKNFVEQYVLDESEKQRALTMLHEGNWGNTLTYKHDMNPLRWLMLQRMNQVIRRGYKQWFVKKGQA